MASSGVGSADWGWSVPVCPQGVSMRDSVFSRMPQATAACFGPSCFESSVATRTKASAISEVKVSGAVSLCSISSLTSYASSMM